MKKPQHRSRVFTVNASTPSPALFFRMHKFVSLDAEVVGILKSFQSVRSGIKHLSSARVMWLWHGWFYPYISQSIILRALNCEVCVNKEKGVITDHEFR